MYYATVVSLCQGGGPCCGRVRGQEEIGATQRSLSRERETCAKRAGDAFLSLERELGIE
jgi:hypothetical protein